MVVRNAFTVDVEEYFQVSAFEPVVSPEAWPGLVSRLEFSMDKMLALLAQADVHATFFILGWLAERYPQLIKRIAQAGHEIASHGYGHQRVTAQTKQAFSDDVVRTRHLLQDLTGTAVAGYRAPSFSILRSTEWAYDILAEAGYQYSSSVYPIVHDHYGVPDAPRFKYKTPQGLWEVPLTTLRIAGKNIPISGGGYFRLYPYILTAWGINHFHAVEKQPYIFYMHPWELDPDQPRQQGLPFKSRFRHYLNLAQVESRVALLLRDFSWGTMRDVIFQDVSFDK